MNRAATRRERRGRAGKLLGGALLIAVGSSRGKLLRLLFTGYGLELLAEGLTGRKLSAHLLSAWQEFAAPGPQFGNGTRDRVDEASWESFPASDPSGAP
jgi:hypothetical protein